MNAMLPAPVWWPETPLEGESLLGFCVRTIEGNFLPHLQSLLQEAGQRYRNRHVDVLRGDLPSESLAALLGVELNVADAMRGRQEGDLLVYRGARMKPADLCSTYRRFAPGALTRSPHHRAAWSIRTLPVCADTLEILQARCVCGRLQTWTAARAVDRCDGCLTRLTGLPAIHPRAENVTALRRYVDLFSPDERVRSGAIAGLPDQLRHLQPHEVVELVLAIAPHAKACAPPNLRSRSCVLAGGQNSAEAIAAAWRVLERWSDGPVVASLEIPVHRVTARSSALLRAGRMLRDPDRELPGPVRAVIAQAAGSYAHPGAGEASSIDYHEAEELLGHLRRTIQRERQAGRLATRFIMRAGEIFPALDREEIKTIAATDHVGAAVLAKRFGAPRYAIEQMAVAGLLTELDHPFCVSTRGFVIAEDSAADLLRDIEAAAVDRLPGRVLSLATALNACGGGEKPYAAALKAMFEGRLAFTLLDRSVPICRRILIAQNDVEELPMAVIPTMEERRFADYVQEDVCSILCIHWRKVDELLNLSTGRVGSANLFPRDDVLSIAADMVSSREVATVLGLRGRAIAKWMRDEGLQPPELFGWTKCQLPDTARGRR